MAQQARQTARQWTALVRPSIRVVTWQPMARAQLAGIVFMSFANKPSADQRLSIAGAAVAATSAFVLDDPATSTLDAAPTSLPRRRIQRATFAGVTIAMWWIMAATITSVRSSTDLSVTSRTLELGTLVAIALAGSAAASAVGDRTTGGIAGAVFVGVWFALSLLPPSRWLPFLAHPDAAGGRTQSLLVLGCALTLLTTASRDPVSRWPGRRRQ
jgi:hypothetical protein